MKKIIVAFVLLLSLSACSSKVDFNGDPDALYMVQKTQEASNYGYNDLPKNNNIIEAYLADIKKHIDNKETFIMYIGYNGCPYCQESVPKLDKAAKKLGITVQYFNYSTERAEADEFHQQTINNFLDHLGLEYVPWVYIFKDGEELTNFSISELSEDELIEKFVKYLSE